MNIGLIIIGDEIMSGRRQDQHFSKMLSILSERGLSLAWAQYIGDDPERITALLTSTLHSHDVVFSTGGIGATPDDHTRQCAAAALGQPIVLHPEAKKSIQDMIAKRAQEKGEVVDMTAKDNLQRLKMGEFPANANIIPNAYNNIPGFYVPNVSGQGAHYFVPGFPVMAWPMMEWVLDTFYAAYFHQQHWQERSYYVFNTPESVLTPLMEAIEAQYPAVKVFSLPSVATQQSRAFIDLGVKGAVLEQVDAAYDMMKQGLLSLHAEFIIA